MKPNFWLVAVTTISTGLAAQTVTNAPTAPPLETPVMTTPAAPTNSTPAPAKKKRTRRAAAKPAAQTELRTVPLVPGPAVVDAHHVNVRGQGKLNSEVITRMTKGDAVTVLEEVHLKKSGPDEPSAWAKIVLPEKAHAWVNTKYIDADKTVKPKKLNLRGGPGENYSVLGVLHKGDPVKEVGTKGEWTEIEATTNAYAFIAAQYLKQEAPGTPATPMITGETSLASTTPVITNAPPITPTTVAEAPAVAPPATNMPDSTINTPVVAAPAITNEAPAMPVAAVAPTNAPEEEGPLPTRIVQREGVVHGTSSIQAPSSYQLMSMDSGLPIDYLYTSSTNLDMSRYKGMHIIVTGEEFLDERWKNRPVLTIHRIQVIE